MMLVSISHSESILSTVSLCSNESVSLDRIIFMGMTHIIRRYHLSIGIHVIKACHYDQRESFVMIVSFSYNESDRIIVTTDFIESSHSIVSISDNDSNVSIVTLCFIESI